MEKINLKMLYFIVVAYVISTSGLYLFGYWGVFNINILPYMGISEIVRFSLLPVLILILCLFIVLVVSSIVATVLAGHVGKYQHLDNYTSSNITFRTFRKYSWRRKIFLCCIVVAVFIVANGAATGTIGMFGMLMVFALTLKSPPFITESIYEHKVIFILIMFLTISVPTSYQLGKLLAGRIKDNKSYSYISENNNYMPGSVLKFLGKSNDYFFFASLDNAKLIVVNKDDINTLILEYYNDMEAVKTDEIHRNMQLKR